MEQDMIPKTQIYSDILGMLWYEQNTKAGKLLRLTEKLSCRAWLFWILPALFALEEAGGAL